MNVSSALTSPQVAYDNTSARVPQKSLGQQDFLKLITVQLTKQDPMKPMEDTAFIAQMAQFTALEQSQQLVKELGYVRSVTELNSASALIGKQATIINEAGLEVTGEISAIDSTASEPSLVINGTSYRYSSLQRVEPMPLPVVASPTPGNTTSEN